MPQRLSCNFFNFEAQLSQTNVTLTYSTPTEAKTNHLRCLQMPFDTGLVTILLTLFIPIPIGEHDEGNVTILYMDKVNVL